MDCACTARDVATGDTYPQLTLYLVESDTGLSPFNVHARRDANFDALKNFLYSRAFTVSRNRIVTF